MQLHAHTNGLLVAGRTAAPEQIGEITVEPPAPWRSADVDLGLDVRNDGKSGFTQVAFRATDEHGVVAAVDAKTILPYERMMSAGLGSEQARADAFDAPMNVTLVIPARRLDQLPAIAGMNNLHGIVDAKLDIGGTANDPNVQLLVRGRGVRTPEMPTDINADADVKLAYDGKVANVEAKVGSGGTQLLDLTSRLELASHDVIARLKDSEAAPQEIPWNASGKVKLASFPLESVPQVAARQVRGRVSGELSLDDLHRDAKLKGRIDLDKLRVGKAHYTKGFVSVDATGGKLAAKLRLDQKDGFLDGGVSTGLTWGAELAPKLDDKQTIEASLDAKAFRAVQPRDGAYRRVVRELAEASARAGILAYDEWVVLEAMGRRLERRIVAARTHQPMPLDGVADEFDAVADQANSTRSATKETTMNKQNTALGHPEPEEASTTALVRDVLGEAKELVRLEIEIAKNEAELELERAKHAAIGFGIALAAGVLVLCLLSVALVLAIGATPLAALAVAASFLGVAGIAAAIGYSVLPSNPLRRTRRRIENDMRQLKEHIA